MTPSDREAAGQRMARARRRRGLSQAVLAGLVGRSESWLSQVERGKRGVDSHSVLMRLADVLRVDIEELTGSGDQDEIGRRAYPAASLIEQAMMGYGAPGAPGGREEPEREVSPGLPARAGTLCVPGGMDTSSRSSRRRWYCTGSTITTASMNAASDARTARSRSVNCC
jgi:transcriptional regulator with XRE-family HTH domain